MLLSRNTTNQIFGNVKFIRFNMSDYFNFFMLEKSLIVFKNHKLI